MQPKSILIRRRHRPSSSFVVARHVGADAFIAYLRTMWLVRCRAAAPRGNDSLSSCLSCARSLYMLHVAATSRRPEPRTRSRPRPRARILLRRRLFFLRHRLGLGPQLNRAPVTLTSNIQKIEYNLGIHLLQLLTEPLPTFICMYAHFTLPRFLSGPLRTSE